MLRRRREWFLGALPLVPPLIAVGVVLVVIAAVGVSPLHALRVLGSGAAGDSQALGVTAIKVTPLLLAGLGIAVAIRAGLWNLGGEGQINMGGLTGAAAALYIAPHAPGPVIIALSLVAGFAGGAAWALVPAVLRAFKGVSEIVTTLLLNFVAASLVVVVVEGPMAQPGASYPQSPPIPAQGQLPIILADTQMHAGILIALGFAFAVGILVWRTVFGFELRAIGSGQKAARFTGIPVRRRLVEALLLSGGLCGVAGSVEILGVQGSLTPGFSPGYGFDAIAVALLGGARTVGILVAACFFGALRAGAPNLKLELDVPASIVALTQGVAIAAAVAAYGIRRQVRRRAALAEQIAAGEEAEPSIEAGATA